ncbi:MAG: glycosyltransferase [Bacteroidota bacterium]
MRKRAIVSVTNDMTHDQRVDRSCDTLVKAGYVVILVGRLRAESKPLVPRSYGMHRMQLLFDKGALFYSEYNVRLLFFLLFQKYDLLVSNDTDTLPANFVAYRLSLIAYPIKKWLKEIILPFSGLRQIHTPRPQEGDEHPVDSIRYPSLLHDCHEYFRGVPELTGRKLVTSVWKWIEDRIFPRLCYIIAVNNSVANLYTQKYNVKIQVIRNVPFRKPLTGNNNRSELNIGPEQKIILYQGALNIDRGLEEAILAMKYLKSDAFLVIAGTGDIFQTLRKFAFDNGLSEKIRFLGQIPFQELHALTQLADLGLSIEKDVSANYYYCLPNKFMDYIQAQVPVLVSPFPEMKTIVDKYVIGEFMESHEPEKLALQIDRILNDQEKLNFYRQNLLKAAADLCWENEEGALSELLSGLGETKSELGIRN